jgi:hypothetical protein
LFLLPPFGIETVTMDAQTNVASYLHLLKKKMHQ